LSFKLDVNKLQPDGETLTLNMPKNLAQGQIEQFWIDDEILLHKLNFTPKVNLLTENYFESESLLSITSFLSGELEYFNKEFNIRKYFKTNKINISMLNYDNCCNFYKKEVPIKAFNLVLTSKFIDNNIDFFKNQKIIDTLKNGINKPYFNSLANNFIDIEILDLLKSIDHMAFDKDLKKLYIQSKVYEIIYQSLNFLNNLDNEYISQDDIYYLNIVKNYIVENIDTEFNLKQLAKTARTNENKLQKSFKIYFNKTVFDYILDCRMEKAKKLLETSDYNIGEVSKKVGYKYQSNFSIAFSKKFGILPKDLIKSRKYYY